MREKIVRTKSGKPVAKVTPKAAGRMPGPERPMALAPLRKSLRAKRATGYRVGTITENDKYGDDSA